MINFTRYERFFRHVQTSIELVYQRNLLGSSYGQGTVAKVVDLEAIVVSCFQVPHHL